MCGFLFGKIFPDQNYLSGYEALKHRGPDSSNHVRVNDYFFGHHRLSIVGVEDSSQPAVSTCGRFILLFNGEIYNYIELRKQLEIRGYVFQTSGDTEVVLNMLIEYGKDAFQKFNGEWAIAFYSVEEDYTWFCRDRYGIKPLYYWNLGSRLLVSSEMKGIYQTDQGVSINSGYFNQIVNNAYSIESMEFTLYKGVERCRPGYLYVYKNNILSIAQYYSLESRLGQFFDDANSLEELEWLLKDSMRLRLRTDVPKAVSLSGGVDSSLVYGLALKQQDIGFVNVNYGQSSFSEKQYVEALEEYSGGKGLYVEADPLSKITDLEKIVYIIEDAYPSFPLPMIELYSQMRNAGYKVSLDGHGVDEMMSGYGQIMSAVGDAFPNLRAIRSISKTYLETFYEEWLPSKLEMTKTIVKEVLRSRLSEDSRRYGNLNSQLLKLTSHTVLPVLLRNYDRYSMYSGVESRSIFMDHRVVEYMLCLPYNKKISEGYNKWIIREIGKKFLPKSIVERKTKFGFNGPMHDYLTGDLKDYFKDWLASERFKSNPYVDVQRLGDKLDLALSLTDIHDQHRNAQHFWLEFNALMLMTSPYLRK